MDTPSYWTDVNDSRRGAIEGYEEALSALEGALDEPLAAGAVGMKRQTERWSALLRGIGEASARLSSVVKTTGARLRDAGGEFLPEDSGESLAERAAAAKARTASLSERVRRRSAEIAAESARRRRRRPPARDSSRRGGTQVDIRV